MSNIFQAAVSPFRIMLDTLSFLLSVWMASPTLSCTSLPPPLVSRGQNCRRMMQPSGGGRYVAVDYGKNWLLSQKLLHKKTHRKIDSIDTFLSSQSGRK